MKPSAKILFTLVAAGALGAVAIACSVSSGTVDDTDGGTSSGQASSSSSGSTTTDAGDGGSTAQECTDLTSDTIDSVACDTCLRHSCCTETIGCQNRAADDGGFYGCDSLNQHFLECDQNTEADPNECKDLTKKAAQTGIPEAYDAYLACRENNCADACGDKTEPPPDGGTK